MWKINLNVSLSVTCPRNPRTTWPINVQGNYKFIIWVILPIQRSWGPLYNLTHKCSAYRRWPVLTLSNTHTPANTRPHGDPKLIECVMAGKLFNFKHLFAFTVFFLYSFFPQDTGLCFQRLPSRSHFHLQSTCFAFAASPHLAHSRVKWGFVLRWRRGNGSFPIWLWNNEERSSEQTKNSPRVQLNAWKAEERRCEERSSERARRVRKRVQLKVWSRSRVVRRTFFRANSLKVQ